MPLLNRVGAAVTAVLLSVGTSGIAGAAQPQDSATGKAVYEYWCAPCHAPGPGHPGTQSLELKYQGAKPAVLLDRTDLPAPAVAAFVRQGVLLMAPFRKTEITDVQLRVLTAYVARNYQSPRGAPHQ